MGMNNLFFLFREKCYNHLRLLIYYPLNSFLMFHNLCDIYFKMFLFLLEKKKIVHFHIRDGLLTSLTVSY